MNALAFRVPFPLRLFPRPPILKYSQFSKDTFLPFFGNSMAFHSLRLCPCWFLWSRTAFSSTLYWFARATVTIPQTGGLNNRNLFSHNCGGWNSKIKVSADWVSSEASLLTLQTATFSFFVLHGYTSVCLISTSVSKSPLLVKEILVGLD